MFMHKLATSENTVDLFDTDLTIDNDLSVEFKHTRIIHPIDEKGPVTCSRCDQTFDDNQELAIHIKCEHLVQTSRSKIRRGRPPKNLIKDLLSAKRRERTPSTENVDTVMLETVNDDNTQSFKEAVIQTSDSNKDENNSHSEIKSVKLSESNNVTSEEKVGDMNSVIIRNEPTISGDGEVILIQAESNQNQPESVNTILLDTDSMIEGPVLYEVCEPNKQTDLEQTTQHNVQNNPVPLSEEPVEEITKTNDNVTLQDSENKKPEQSLDTSVDSPLLTNEHEIPEDSSVISKPLQNSASDTMAESNRQNDKSDLDSGDTLRPQDEDTEPTTNDRINEPLNDVQMSHDSTASANTNKDEEIVNNDVMADDHVTSSQEISASQESKASDTSVKRKRGRPRKNPLIAQTRGDETSVAGSQESSQKLSSSQFESPGRLKRNVGRPRRYEDDDGETSSQPSPSKSSARSSVNSSPYVRSSPAFNSVQGSFSPAPGKRKRGRPRKYVPAENEGENEDDEEDEDSQPAAKKTDKSSDKIAFNFTLSPSQIRNSPTPIRPQRERRSTLSKSEWIIPKFCRVKGESMADEDQGYEQDDTKMKPKDKSVNELSGKKSEDGEISDDIEQMTKSKNKDYDGEENDDEDGDWKPKPAAACPVVKRGRGRPRKYPSGVPRPVKRFREEGETLKKSSTLQETKDNCNIFLDEHNEVMYGCKECNKQFNKLHYLDRHMAMHRGTFTCEQCSKSFARKETLMNHSCVANSKEEGESQEDCGQTCNKCGKMFVCAESLIKHMAIHTDKYRCEVCRRAFVCNETLKSHMCKGPPNAYSRYKPEKKFACDFCGQAFVKQKYLYRHMAAHTGEFTCDTCDRWFSRKEALLSHMRKCNPNGVAADEETFPCDQCHKVFSKRTTLENHMNVHRECYKCNDCKKSFASATTLETHHCIPVTEKDGQFVCETCNKTFSRQIYLVKHMAVHSEGVYCNLCNRRFARKDEVVKHMVLCASNMKIQNQGSVECHVCGEAFTKSEQYIKHIKSHTHPYKCNDCGRMFKRRINMQGHKCDPTEDQPAECYICKREFRNVKLLKRHMNIHTGAQYQCEICQKKFHRAELVDNHMCRKPDGTLVRKKEDTKKIKQKALDEAPHMCHICGKAYISGSNLNKHMTTHGKKDIECPICKKLFYHRSAMNEHMKGVHTDRLDFTCKECGRSYKSRNSLVMHVHNFHASTITVYECPTCSRQFRQKGNLKKHMLTHSDKKTYLCTHCDKMFKYPEQLRRHTLEHVHGQRHSCNFCERKFVMMHELKKHVKIFHQGMVYGCEICGIECRHYHTMKRHLKRRHPEIMPTQDYVRNLLRKSKNIQRFRPQLAQPPVKYIAIAKQEQTTPDGVVATGEPITIENGVEQPTHTFIIEKPEGMDTDEQTVVIQTTGQFDSDALVSQQVAEALQSLRESAGIEGIDGETTISIGDISQLVPGQPIPVTLTGVGNSETQGFILMPTVVEEEQQVQEIAEQVLQSQAMQDQSIQQHAIQVQVVQDQSMHSQVIQDQVIQDQVIQEQSLQVQVIQDQVIQDQVIQDQVIQDQVIQDQVIQEQSIQVQAVQDQVIQDQVMQDQSIQEITIN